MAGGRPSKYTDDTVNLVRQYLNTWMDNEKPCKAVFPSVAGLALFLHVARETIWSWTQDAEKAEFTNLIGELMAEQEFILAAKGTAGEFNAPLTKLFLHKHGHSDKLETKTTGQISVTVSEQDLAL